MPEASGRFSPDGGVCVVEEHAQRLLAPLGNIKQSGSAASARLLGALPFPFHRGEYVEIASRLTQLRYDCLTIDQRSEMSVLGGVNETCARAKERKLATGYVAARPDIGAAVQYTADACSRQS
jgi:hypothetical protein